MRKHTHTSKCELRWWVVKLKIQWKLVYCALCCNWMRKTLCAAAVIYFHFPNYLFLYMALHRLNHPRSMWSSIVLSHQFSIKITPAFGKERKKKTTCPLGLLTIRTGEIVDGNFYKSYFFYIDLNVVNDNDMLTEFN